MEQNTSHSDNGFFDNFGGKYVAEVLRRPLDELEIAFSDAMKDKDFLELPHMAFSGRMFERDIPDLIGNGERLYERIMNEIKR